MTTARSAAFLGAMLACLALAACTTKVPPPPAATRKPPPATTAKPAPAKKRFLPGPKDLGPRMSLANWKVLCEDGDLAMMCRRTDPTDRRCAARRDGRYRWTYASYCDAALPCYRKACPD